MIIGKGSQDLKKAFLPLKLGTSCANCESVFLTASSISQPTMNDNWYMCKATIIIEKLNQ